MKKSAKGFTLIELLITISIISVLSAIGLVVFSTVMKQGRDAKRMSDLRSIQSALEQYYSDQGFYPSEFISLGGGENGLKQKLNGNPNFVFDSKTGNPSPPPLTKTYINSLPNDPNDTHYGYETTPDACGNDSTKCSYYCLFTHLENPPSVLPDVPTNCAGPSYPIGYNFFVTLP